MDYNQKLKLERTLKIIARHEDVGITRANELDYKNQCDLRDALLATVPDYVAPEKDTEAKQEHKKKNPVKKSTKKTPKKKAKK